MSYSLVYDEEKHVLIYTSKVRRSKEDVKQLIFDIIEQTSKAKCYLLICDVREITEPSNISDVIDLAKFQNKIPQTLSIKTAIVHNKNKEVSKAYDLFADLCKMAGHKIKCFTDIDEAFEWLKTSNESTTSQFNFPV